MLGYLLIFLSCAAQVNLPLSPDNEINMKMILKQWMRSGLLGKRDEWHLTRFSSRVVSFVIVTVIICVYDVSCSIFTLWICQYACKIIKGGSFNTFKFIKKWKS